MGGEAMQDLDPRAVVEAYIATFESGDVPQCVGFFTQDAVIEFGLGTYRGKQAIEEWHRERFDADLQLISLDGIEAEGDTVVIQVVGTSRRLRSFRIDSLKGTGTFLILEGKIKEARFAPSAGFAGHMNWLFGQRE
jgi:hypothetical protein